MSVQSKKIYAFIKKGELAYNEAVHCQMVVEELETKGTMSAFCVAASISDRTFYRWMHKYPNFSEAYRIGCMIARENWEEEGRQGKFDENFNLELWKTQGSSRFGVGRTNRVRVHIDIDTTPYEQYQQLMNQASMGDFNAAELKQLMEAINIGIRAYESFELQRQVDAMKNDLTKMSQHHGNNIFPIAQTA